MPFASKHDQCKHLQRQTQTALLQCRMKGWERKVEDVSYKVNSKNSNMFFSTIEAVYLPPKPCTTQLLTIVGTTLLKEKNSINGRWREHFTNLLNRPSTVNTAVLDQIPQKPTLDSLDLSPTLDEVKEAISQTNSGRGPGMNGIHAEIFQSTGPVTLKAFHSIVTSI